MFSLIHKQRCKALVWHLLFCSAYIKTSLPSFQGMVLCLILYKDYKTVERGKVLLFTKKFQLVHSQQMARNVLSYLVNNGGSVSESILAESTTHVYCSLKYEERCRDLVFTASSCVIHSEQLKCSLPFWEVMS